MLILLAIIFAVIYVIVYFWGMKKVKDTERYKFGMRAFCSLMVSLIPTITIWLWILGIIHLVMC